MLIKIIFNIFKLLTLNIIHDPAMLKGEHPNVFLCFHPVPIAPD